MVYLQTFNPDHCVIHALRNQNRDGFIAVETAARAEQLMPPFGRLIAITLAGREETQVMAFARSLIKCAPTHENVTIYGPAPAPIALLRGNYRWRLLVKSSKSFPIQSYVKTWLGKLKSPNSIQVTLDVDPQSFL